MWCVLVRSIVECRMLDVDMYVCIGPSCNRHIDERVLMMTSPQPKRSLDHEPRWLNTTAMTTPLCPPLAQLP